jgi:membrane associated rhomboid family serine protease
MIGASGAISGVLGAYMLLYPHARVLVFIPFGLLSQLVNLPALWVLRFWFIFQVLNSVLKIFPRAALSSGPQLPKPMSGIFRNIILDLAYKRG